MKKKIISFVFIIIFIAGAGAVLYPSFSNWLNKRNSTRIIQDYNEAISNIKQEDYEKYIFAARQHNEKIAQKNSISDVIQMENEDHLETYNSLLNVTGDGVMGILKIPVIKVVLPIYHTTEESVLQKAAGHYIGSSLPCGGESTHSILSGHRGLPSAKLFTDLDMLAIDDMFYIDILGDTLAYRIDQIRIIEPYLMDELDVIPGEDHVTLVTCTPYGVNTHRLLIRGTRVPYEPQMEENMVSLENTKEKPEDQRIEKIGIFAILVFGIAVFAGMLCGKMKKKGRGRK